jgi:enterochelin esterase family protein
VAKRHSALVGGLLSIVVLTPPLFAQTPPPPNIVRAPAAAAPAPPSVEVHADGRVTFRLLAPDANAVAVAIDRRSHPMTKDAAGLWSTTVGPLVPEIYEYTFAVDGARRVLDSRNPWSKPGEFAASLLDVPGTPPRFDQVQNVPHGALELLTYRSTPYGKQRNLWVYLPPQYVSEPARRFPVLYLRHGNGDTEMSWPFQGQAGVILENMLAAKQAVPMLIVMPYGESGATGGTTPEGLAALDREMNEDIIPMVEGRFRVLADRENRAIAGLSMGGTQALYMGLKHLDRYAWVAEFSSGVASDTIQSVLPAGTDLATLNRQLHLLFLACGTEDPRYAGHLELVDALTKQGLKPVWYSGTGAHEMKVWRHALGDLLPRLFKGETR